LTKTQETRNLRHPKKVTMKHKETECTTQLITLQITNLATKPYKITKKQQKPIIFQHQKNPKQKTQQSRAQENSKYLPISHRFATRTRFRPRIATINTTKRILFSFHCLVNNTWINNSVVTLSRFEILRRRVLKS